MRIDPATADTEGPSPAGRRLPCKALRARAAAEGVAVGARFSYRDLAGFGRRFLDVEPDELADDLLYQLAALDGMARAAGTRVSYVEPHGALYDAAVTHEGHARAVVDAVLAFDRRLPVLGLPGSALLRSAEAAGMRPVAEGFADRGYTGAGTLVPGTRPGALLHDPAEVAERAGRMAAEGVVETVDGTALLMPVKSICVRGDTLGAVELARTVRSAMEAAGLSIAPLGGAAPARGEPVPWSVTADSDRVGLRLSGARLRRARSDELPSGGLVPGALQVPADGAPVLFLTGPPVTGGCPVLAVVRTADVAAVAQVRPGDILTLRAG